MVLLMAINKSLGFLCERCKMKTLRMTLLCELVDIRPDLMQCLQTLTMVRGLYLSTPILTMVI